MARENVNRRKLTIIMGNQKSKVGKKRNESANRDQDPMTSAAELDGIGINLRQFRSLTRLRKCTTKEYGGRRSQIHLESLTICGRKITDSSEMPYQA